MPFPALAAAAAAIVPTVSAMLAELGLGSLISGGTAATTTATTTAGTTAAATTGPVVGSTTGTGGLLTSAISSIGGLLDIGGGGDVPAAVSTAVPGFTDGANVTGAMTERVSAVGGGSPIPTEGYNIAELDPRVRDAGSFIEDWELPDSGQFVPSAADQEAAQRFARPDTVYKYSPGSSPMDTRMLTSEDIFFEGSGAAEEGSAFRKFAGDAAGLLKDVGWFVAEQKIPGVKEYRQQQGALKFQQDIQTALANDPNADLGKVASFNISAEERSRNIERFQMRKTRERESSWTESLRTGVPSGVYAGESIDALPQLADQNIKFAEQARKRNWDIESHNLNIQNMQSILGERAISLNLRRAAALNRIEQNKWIRTQAANTAAEENKTAREQGVYTSYTTAVMKLYDQYLDIQKNYPLQGERSARQKRKNVPVQLDPYKIYLKAKDQVLRDFPAIFADQSGFNLAEVMRIIEGGPPITTPNSPPGFELHEVPEKMEVPEFGTNTGTQ